MQRAVRSFEISAFRIHRHGAWHAVVIKRIGRFRFKGEVDGQPKLLRVVSTPRRVELHFVVERPAERACAKGEPQGIDRGSRRRHKCRRALAREWQRVREREHGKRHELTARLVREFGNRFLLRISRSARCSAITRWRERSQSKPGDLL